MSPEFETIYEMHNRKVYNLALQYVQNAEDAEEITQDVFVTIYEKIGQFRGESSLETWIYRITINKSLDHLKSRKRRRRWVAILSFGNAEEETAHFDHPGVQFEDKEALERLFAVINQLPGQQKTALILSKIEHLSHKEIAEIMGLSTKAVESLLSRAKENIRKKIT